MVGVSQDPLWERAKSLGADMHDELTIKIVDQETWRDLEKLFEGKGGPKNCWCMVWRAQNQERKRTDGKSKKSFLKKRIASRIPVGILAFKNNEPIAWCSIAPKETYRKLDALELNEPNERIWSIVCFYIRKEFRRSKLTSRLIQSAIDYARVNKATVVEAYPVDQDAPRYRVMGFVSMFQEHGFEEIGRAGTRRHVMRLRLYNGDEANPT